MGGRVGRRTMVGAVVATAVGLAVVAVPPVATAQEAPTSYALQATLIPTVAQGAEFFGMSVAVDGNTAVVGAPNTKVGSNNVQGSVRVYVRTGATWSLQTTILAEDGTEHDSFGESVAIDGDTIVVGAPDDAIGPDDDQGSARVFVRIGTAWAPQATLVDSDGRAGDNFGAAVAIDGDTIVVGAPDHGLASAFTTEGAAWVFARTGTVWSSQGKLTAADAAIGDNFGASVDVSGTTVIIGVPDDAVGPDAGEGSARVFVRSASVWSPQATLGHASAGASDHIGRSVALEGHTAIVGAPGLGANGSALVLVRTGTTWGHQATLDPGPDGAMSAFGHAVALSGGTAVVGAPLDAPPLTSVNDGSARVFTRAGTTWTMQVVLDDEPLEQNRFGTAVAVSARTVIVGAPFDEVDGTLDQGSARIFARPRPAPSDFDGGGDTDIAVFRPSSARWYIAGGPTVSWGVPGDVPVPGDYDGNGTTDLAVFRPTSGRWYVQGGITVAHGVSGDVPVPADYDGNGTDDVAVYRPSTGHWYVHGRPGIGHGLVGDIPVPADYDGNGTADIAVFRPSNGRWYVQGRPGALWGITGDIPVPGDYDGNGTADVAVLRPSNGRWYVQGGATVAHGVQGDVPVPADFDGNGTTDIAVFRPTTGRWYVHGAAAVPHGLTGDIPTSAPPHLRAGG